MIAGLDPWAQDAIRVGTGLAAGALIGLERGFKLRNQADGTRVAGVRTFTLLGLGSGLAGLISEDQPFAAGIIVLAQLAYLAIAYSPRLRAKGDATSPVAAAATIATAFLGGMGSVGLAIAAAAPSGATATSSPRSTRRTASPSRPRRSTSTRSCSPRAPGGASSG